MLTDVIILTEVVIYKNDDEVFLLVLNIACIKVRKRKNSSSAIEQLVNVQDNK
jgi:hypothetical protein